MIEPTLHPANANHRGVLAWVLPSGTMALSSAPVGGGLTHPQWVLNTGVAKDYARTDLDAHARSVAFDLGLDGPGTAMFTAADVGRVRRAENEGVLVHATVGISKPTWAADPHGGWNDWAAGTINVVVQVPVGLALSAAVNAVATITEAKTQALIEAGVPGTGTASDAVTVLWPDTGASSVEFAGPRSQWGARIALATHHAVTAGIEAAQV